MPGRMRAALAHKQVAPPAHDLPAPPPTEGTVFAPADGEEEALASRRPWYGIGVLLLIAAFVLRQPLLVGAALLVAALGAIPELWYRFSLRGLSIRQEFASRRAQVGDEVTLSLVVENRKALPLPRLVVRDDVPQELPLVGMALQSSPKPRRATLTNLLSPWAFQRITRRYHVQCMKRGLWTFGPIKLESSDPFGLLTREARLEDGVSLLIYPLIVPVERLGLPARAPLGERAAPRRLLEDPVRIAGVRDYAPGDDPRHVHWKATARSGALQTKLFEPSTHHTLAVFLDLRTYPSYVSGHDEDRAELAICAAASVAHWAVEQRYAVGLYATGSLAAFQDELNPPPVREPGGGKASDAEPALAYLRRGREMSSLRVRVPPSSDSTQMVRIAEVLARLVPYFAGPIAEVVAREESALPFGCTIVYVGAAAALDLESVAAFERLRAHGHAVTLLLTGDEPVENAGLPVIRLGGSAAWQHLMEEVFASHGLDRNGRPLDHDAGDRAGSAAAVSFSLGGSA